jgi:hypothetical protein
MLSLLCAMAAPLFAIVGYALSRLDDPAAVKGLEHPTDYIPPPAF